MGISHSHRCQLSVGYGEFIRVLRDFAKAHLGEKGIKVVSYTPSCNPNQRRVLFLNIELVPPIPFGAQVGRIRQGPRNSESSQGIRRRQHKGATVQLDRNHTHPSISIYVHRNSFDLDLCLQKLLRSRFKSTKAHYYCCTLFALDVGVHHHQTIGVHHEPPLTSCRSCGRR